jgi:hypothetical protein
LLRVAERPNFVALDDLAREVDQCPSLVVRGCLTNVLQQVADCLAWLREWCD